MKKPLKKIILILSISLFMTSCFPTRQSCGLAHIEKSVKTHPTQVTHVASVTIKKATVLK